MEQKKYHHSYQISLRIYYGGEEDGVDFVRKEIHQINGKMRKFNKKTFMFYFLSSILYLCCLWIACSQRDVSTPENALIGHWVWHSVEIGEVHYYFSDKEIIMIGKMNEESPVQKRFMTYTILSKARDHIEIHVVPTDSKINEGHIKNLKFSYDYKTLVEIPEIWGMKLSPRDWEYVDTRQKP